MRRFSLVGLLFLSLSAALTAADSPDSATSPHWHSSYAEAMREAKGQRKMLLVLFEKPGSQASAQVESKLASDEKLRPALDNYVVVKTPLDATIQVEGKDVVVSKHPAFSEIHGREGLAVIDLVNVDSPHYNQVVSVFPFASGKYYRFSPEQLGVILALPKGTLTQRTMIYAVRVHPERPASTRGAKDPVLTSEAASHSTHQAQIGVQGHHNWDSRFQRIIGKLLGLRPTYIRSAAPVEVVAESWPGQGLLDSCVDCVASWRQSPGHWNAVNSSHAGYGYDIRQGVNGIWYATGIFSN